MFEVERRGVRWRREMLEREGKRVRRAEVERVRVRPRGW